MNTLIKRATAIAMATAAAIAMAAGTSHAASRAIDIYIHNYGAYHATAKVWQGQYPNGGAPETRYINSRGAYSGQSAYFRVYLDDWDGWTIRGAADAGKSTYFTFGQGSASTVCFRFDGTTIAGFGFNITSC
ncbi:hypothetical protein UK23_21285 [Lentzea aerocolonigenes]|uniref:Secreted protein n=1 Tax=Lentzea aerocolonigenes TaxID=68170 RepID=A0A0F0GV07_LENAE|nr:hypothetical protein [Lentzea aerocolonigenes]KJK47120.1 hypothetical protein UK23_21285 [Lentzea aerocolonigenes]